jgi:hypothetical protein
MAVIGYAGKLGSFQYDSNKFAAINKWGLTITKDAPELPAFGQNDMNYAKDGVRKNSFTFSGLCPSTDANMVTNYMNMFSSTNTAAVSSTHILNLVVSTVAGQKKKFFGFVVWTSLAVDNDFGGVVGLSGAGVFNGGVNVSTT